MKERGEGEGGEEDLTQVKCKKKDEKENLVYNTVQMIGEGKKKSEKPYFSTFKFTSINHS